MRNEGWHAGTDLIRKVEGNEDAEPCFGVTFPLLLKADGRKFGKSEDGAVWLAAGASVACFRACEQCSNVAAPVPQARRLALQRNDPSLRLSMLAQGHRLPPCFSSQSLLRRQMQMVNYGLDPAGEDAHAQTSCRHSSSTSTS